MKTFFRASLYALAFSFLTFGTAACGGDDDDAGTAAAQGSATGGAVKGDDIVSLMCRPDKWVDTEADSGGYYWVAFSTDGTFVDGHYKDGAYTEDFGYNTWSLNTKTNVLTLVYNAASSDPDEIDVDRYTVKSVTANVAVLVDEYGDEYTYVAR